MASLAQCLVLLLLLCNISYASVKGEQWWENAPPPVVHGKVMPASWWASAKQAARLYNTDPFRVVAVMWMESGGFKTGSSINGSRFVPPCGFNKYCSISREILYTPELQIAHAVMRLSGNDFVSRLKVYNKTWYKNKYVPHVLALKNQLEREAMVQLLLCSKK